MPRLVRQCAARHGALASRRDELLVQFHTALHRRRLLSALLRVVRRLAHERGVRVPGRLCYVMLCYARRTE